MKFYRDITLGYYMPMDSALHRIEAGAKIIELMALIIIFMDLYGPRNQCLRHDVPFLDFGS